MNTYRILIADDHSLARKAIHSLMDRSSFTIVGEAVNGLEAIRLAEQLLPDAVLMDLQMPQMDGLEATRRIKQQFPQMKIVILTVSDDVVDLFTAIKYGAQGYLLKNMDPTDWLDYLHALLEDDPNLSRDIADRLFTQFQSRSRALNDPAYKLLTVREKEILGCVSTGISNKQIAENLNITENTVKNHIKNVLEKLQMDNRVQLTAFALRHGIRERK